jgi:hypothetical protein
MARLTIAAGVAFLLLLGIVHFAKADLDPSYRPISEYALGDHGFLMTLAFLSWGLAAMSLPAALRPHVVGLGGWIGLVFLVIGGAGPMLAALFPMDSIQTPPEAMTASGHMHSLGAMLGDGIPIGAALITWSLARRNPAWSKARRPLIATAVLTWVGVVVLTLMLAAVMSQDGVDPGANIALGWPARFMIATQMSWVLTAARFAASLGRRTASSV